MLEVIFAYYRSGREHRALFDMRSEYENNRMALEVAWKTNSRIVSCATVEG